MRAAPARRLARLADAACVQLRHFPQFFNRIAMFGTYSEAQRDAMSEKQRENTFWNAHEYSSLSYNLLDG
jgi:hypothetical protein